MIKAIFINPIEHRLRAGWRLLLYLLLLLLLTGGFSIVLGLVLSLSKSTSLAWLYSILSGLLTLAAIVAATLIAARWVDRHPFSDFGFHFSQDWWIDFGFGLTLGALLMAFIFGVESAAGWITIEPGSGMGAAFWEGIAISLVLFICVGIYEELFSRGYLLHNLAEGLNLRFISPKSAVLIAYLVSSSIFGALHAANPNASLISTLNLIVAGLFLGLGFVLTGNLAISIGLHMTWNFFQGNVFGFPVSGSGAGASFINIQQGGPELWTGGSFGPEAGLIGIAAIALGSLLIVLWVRYRYGRISLCQDLALYSSAALTPAAAQPQLGGDLPA
jgi:uncharacterized protein